MKPYDLGLIVGRFNVIHIGHKKLIDTGLMLCDRVLVLVGSAQEAGTIRNPFDCGVRIKMITEIYGNHVIVHPISDLTHENDITPDWGKYVLDKVEQVVYKKPEIMIYGNDEARSKWFDSDDIKDTSEFIINRNQLPFSATAARELMVKDNIKEWMKFHDPKLHKFYPELRQQLMQIGYYKELFQKEEKK